MILLITQCPLSSTSSSPTYISKNPSQSSFTEVSLIRIHILPQVTLTLHRPTRVFRTPENLHLFTIYSKPTSPHHNIDGSLGCYLVLERGYVPPKATRKNYEGT
ncbi:hypothetical protein JAAARDRAFT_537623 [Jaapia argillacea MUCL 33604]|uniref:Uncharacterized protein n=1 Tax=Jaapia argillacea MUCL 33604 TaxID=933084 RepID=A0A067PBS0_9AGAM|nr:hypothetical protein JAAARDRAFT_537623 [Jaapia argillacea MUCL 33604]